jgi:ABC-type sugar transport system ATPase subunit/ribose/xylose/arabinose/galactoside ABC-type transport system permease subunit
VTPLVEVRGVSMQFPGVRALTSVSLSLQPGEVHAIVGENGAGKSTLVKILSGALSGYQGSVFVDGFVRLFASPRDAMSSGIASIPQELQLVSSLSVAENICLGHEPRRANAFLDRARMAATAAEQLEIVGARPIDAGVPVATLEAADRQMVAIARAILLNARCLIMDEPTASLGPGDASRLGALIRRLAMRGTAIVYVSHKLDEVRRLADRVTVLRDGHLVSTRAGGVPVRELVRLMVGRDIEPAALTPVRPDAPERLRVESLSVADPSLSDGWRLQDVSLRVRAGEIVGLAGLVGAGRTDFLLALAGGLERRITGRIVLDGRHYVPVTPAEARDAGMVILPEERKTDGILPRLSVADNITIGALGSLSRGGLLRRGAIHEAAERMMRGTGVRAASTDVPIQALSGGNQQKALLARCLFASPRVLLLDEPTRGVDLGARAAIFTELNQIAARGMAIVLASSEMAEILTQCHRVIVFREGRVVAEFEQRDATEENVLAAAAGARAGEDQPEGGGHSPPLAPPASSGGSVSRAFRALPSLRPFIGLLLVVVLAVIFSPVRNGRPVFLDLGNLTDIVRQVSEKGILAVGMTAVVISGGIDLSVGSVLAFGATLAAWLLTTHHLGLLPTTLLVLLAGASWGLLNGLIVARWRLPAFIATLAAMSAARGAARFLSGGSAIPLAFGAGGVPESVRALAAPVLPNVPAPGLIFGLTVLLMHVYLRHSRSGRYVHAIGDNESAARLAGVRVAWHKAAVYVIAGTLAALAGLVHMAQLEQGNPNDGVAYELDAIAAVVIGGTTLSGGTGTVLGTLVGILTIGVINNLMGLNNVDANLQLILKGVIIVVAVWLQRRRGS